MRPLVLAALLVAAPTALAAGLLPAEAPAGGPVHVWVESFDGTMLRATWFTPATDAPFPVVLRTHGWAGHREVTATPMVQGLLDRGYGVLTWDSRGFGESGGMVELNSPDFEVKDVQALLDWVAEQEGVRLDGPGDPRVGMSGGSYAGGIQLLAAVFDPRLDALAPEVTWNDLRQSLAPNGVLKAGWVALLYGSGQVSGYTGTIEPDPSRFTPNAEGVNPVLTRWLAQSLAENRLTEEAADALAYRSFASYLDQLEDFPPTMLVQGLRDTLFTPNEALWTHRALHARGFDSCVLLHGGGHGYATPDEAYIRTKLLDFFDYWLLETTAPVPPEFEVWEGWGERWQVLGSWPEGGGERWDFNVGVAAGGLALMFPGNGWLSEPGYTGATVVLPATVAPASYTAAPEFDDELRGAGPVDAPLASAVWAKRPFPETREVVGTIQARLTFLGPVPDASVFVRVLDVAPDGSYEVVGDQVTALRLESGNVDELRIDLELAAIAHRFEAGHRFAIALATSDAGHAASRSPLPVLFQADGNSYVVLPA